MLSFPWFLLMFGNSVYDSNSQAAFTFGEYISIAVSCDNHVNKSPRPHSFFFSGKKTFIQQPHKKITRSIKVLSHTLFSFFFFFFFWEENFYSTTTQEDTKLWTLRYTASCVYSLLRYRHILSKLCFCTKSTAHLKAWA